MMLVTLVENAIRHGLNPLPEGGEVRIHAHVTDGKLRVQVIDTGAGLSESSGPGVGLANIRARLSHAVRRQRAPPARAEPGDAASSPPSSCPPATPRRARARRAA